MTKARNEAYQNVQQAQKKLNKIIKFEQSKCTHSFGPLRDIETQEYADPNFIRTCSKCDYTEHVKYVK